MVRRSWSLPERVTALAATMVALTGAAIWTGGSGGSDASHAQEQFEMPECPGHWELLPKRLGGRIAPYGFALTGPITNVPEFHDCQRLISQEGRGFGPLVAVFASYELESLERRLQQLEGPAAVRRETGDTPRASEVQHIALSAGLILNLDLRTYGPLGIRPGFSCLYTWRTDSAGTRVWRALILPVDTAQSQCERRVSPDTLTPSHLRVIRDVVPGYEGGAENHYPPVARWDRDPRSGLYYIGIKCGAGWCEIGVGPTFTPSRPAISNDAATTPGRRVQRIKGWYDQQELADVNSFGDPVPSGITGTVFPDSMLDQRDSADFARKWVTTSYIALSGRSRYYKSMLNLDAVAPSEALARMNRLSLCRGTREECGVPAPSDPTAAATRCGLERFFVNTRRWWVRIDAAGGGPPMYRCVTRREHHDLGDKTIPGTARWRWLRDDETVWQECLEGCCEVDATVR